MYKRSFHVSDEWDRETQELVSLLGLKGTYGAEAKALQFSTTFSLWCIKSLEKGLPVLEPDKMSLFITSINTLRKREVLDKKSKELLKEVSEVTPEFAEKVIQGSTEHV